MNIKAILILTTLVMFVVFIGFTVTIYRSLQLYSAAINDSKYSSNMALEIMRRRLYADDYLLHSTLRAKEQWYIQQGSIEKLLSDNKIYAHSREEQDYLDQLKKSVEESKGIFESLVQLTENPNANSSSSLQEQRISLVTQLTLKAGESIEEISGIDAINEKQASDYFNRVIEFYSITSGVLFILLFISFGITWRSANKLNQSNRRFELISNTTKDVIYDWNVATGKVWFNDSLQKLFGYSQDQISYTLDWFVSHIHPEDSKIVAQDIDKILKSNQSSNVMEYRFSKADGTYADVRDRGFVERDNSGKPTRYLGSIEDISHDKELDRLKDEFLSVASHELRTPMGAIRSLVTTVLDGDYGPVPENLKDPLIDVNLSTQRLIKLVNDMLNIARIESGRLTINLTEVDLRSLTEELVRDLKPLASDKNIDLKFAGFDEVKVQADPDKIKQLYNNLIGNSLKFTTKGSITISSKIVGELIEVYIEDTGSGISVADQQKLFGKFEQGSSEAAGRPDGSGLGLYISKQLVEKMGGKMWIEKSEVGKGSTFAFSLPLVNSQLAKKVAGVIQLEAASNPDQKELSS